MKLVSKRGPNWPEAKEIAAMVTEKAVPPTVSVAPAIVDRTSRAPEGLMLWYQPRCSRSQAPSVRISSQTMNAASAIAPLVMMVGKNQ
jgi:hypothetical protein